MSEWTTGNDSGGYSTADMMRMQREAEERVREMQEHSRRVLENGPRYPSFAKPPEAPRAQTETTPRTTTQNEPLRRASSSFQGARSNTNSHSGGSAGDRAARTNSQPTAPDSGVAPQHSNTHHAEHTPEPRAQTFPHHPIAPPEPTETARGGLLSALGGSLGGLLKGGGDGPISRVMDALGIDNDKIIVLALLLILLNNNADKKLILALCYILL